MCGLQSRRRDGTNRPLQDVVLFRFFDQMLVTVERAQKNNMWYGVGKDRFLRCICCKHNILYFSFKGCNMGLTSLEVVKVYRLSVPYIQEKLGRAVIKC